MAASQPGLNRRAALFSPLLTMTDTLLQQLTAWLDDPRYDAGVQLYKQMEGEGFLLRLFQTGPDDYNRAKLHQVLTEAHARLLTAEADLQAKLPHVLQTQLAAMPALMDERTVLKEKLRTAFVLGRREGDDLKTMAYRILQIRDELDTVYGRKKFFAEHGFFPDSAAETEEGNQVVTPAELLKRRNTLRTYVTRYRKAFNEAPGDEARARVLAKLKPYQTELDAIDNQLARLFHALPD